MAGRPVKQDHYQGCLKKQRVTVHIDQEAVYWLKRLAQMEEAIGGDLGSFSRQIRNALHMYLKYKVPSQYRMTDEHFIKSNERTGKLYNGHRY